MKNAVKMAASNVCSSCSSCKDMKTYQETVSNDYVPLSRLDSHISIGHSGLSETRATLWYSIKEGVV